MEGAGNCNPVGLIQDFYTLIEKETQRDCVRFPDYKYVMECYTVESTTNKDLIELECFSKKIWNTSAAMTLAGRF